MSQYSTDSSIDESTVLVILNIVNQALLYAREATNDEISKISAYLSSKVKEISGELLKDACGEDYSSYIIKCIK